MTDERDVTPVERALTRVRLAAFAALQEGGSRQDIERETAEAFRIHTQTGRPR